MASPTGSVLITGTATQNQILTASLSTSTISPPAFADADGLGAITYQWQSSSDSGTTWSNVKVGGTLTLTEPLVGKTIRVLAKYTDGSGAAESVASSSTAVVGNVNDSPSGSVTISGTTTQGQTLAATNTVADDDGLGTISYQWQSNDGLQWSPIVGSTTAVLTLSQNEVGKTVRVVASYTDGHLANESVASSASATIANINDSPTGSVNITGTVTINQTLTASLSVLSTGSVAFDDPDGLGIVTYQWQSSSNGTTWTNLSTGTTLGLSSAQTGKYVRVVASYTDSQGTAESVASSSTSTVTGINTPPTGSVSITGTTTQGQTLTAVNNLIADADGLGTITYQWQSSSDNGSTWGNLSTGSTLVLAEAQVGKLVRVTANYVDGQSTSESIPSTATSAVANINDALSGSVAITGTVTQGQTLTASNTLADADGLGTIGYQWETSSDSTTWSALAGSTASTLVLAEAQVGKYIRVKASYTDNHSTNESAYSSATSAVANINDALSGSVAITGTVTQGQTLTASNTLADVDGLGTITYQWQTSSDSGTNWSNLSTGSTLVLAEAQVGKLVRVKASYTDGHGTAESASSSATAAVANLNDALSGSVTVTGSAMVNQTLTAANTLADADGLGTISYQWQSSTDNGTSWSDVSGGTASTLTVSLPLLNSLIRVKASYTDGHGTTESANSSATTVVLPPNIAPTGSVVIGGTVEQNQILRATNTVADADGLGTITYQWQTSSDGTTWSNLSTGSTVTLAEAQVGKTIRVSANYTDGMTLAQSVTSSATVPVVNVNDVLTGSATISGTVSLNQVLTASNTLADTDGLGTITYTWQNSSDGTTWTDVSTGSTLGLSEAHIGKFIRVKAGYTDGHGTAEAAFSSATAKVTNINNSPTGSVTIAGTATQNQTLTASKTLVDSDGTTTSTFIYQWQASSDNGSTWTNLTTGTTLVLAEAQVGKKIRVLASYTDDLFTSESSASSSTTTVANVDDDPTGSVAIGGAAVLNETLTASNTLADPDGLGTITYTWQTSSDGSSWSALSTGSTLGLSEAQVGKLIRVVASYTDARGAAESVASSATAAVTTTGTGGGNGGGDGGETPVYGGDNDKITLGDDGYVVDAGSGNNVISAGAGSDQITSGGGNDKINGGDGDNIIDAGDGKNVVVAGDGNDQVTTGSGSDRIDTGAGNDIVYCGAGRDKVALGLGTDTFVFDNRASGGADTLSFFNGDDDFFAFQGDVFDALAGGITSENVVIAGKASAKETDDVLLFDTRGRKLYYDADGSGSEKPVLLATIKVVITGISADNFVLI
jgi:hypothetical protein